MFKIHKKAISLETSGIVWHNPDHMSGRAGGRVKFSAELDISLDNEKDAKSAVERWERTVHEFLASLGEEENE